MRMIDLIERKKRGGALSEKEIRYFIKGFTSGEIPDYQAAALLMAICFMGMTDQEIAWMTDAMACSGDRVDLSSIPGIKVDKHSTGGIGCWQRTTGSCSSPEILFIRRRSMWRWHRTVRFRSC